MFTFTSVAPRRRIFGKPVLVGKEMIPEYDVKFTRMGSAGQFTTNDEKIAESLRKHPEFGRTFVEIGLGNIPQKSNIISGIRSSATQPELGKVQPDPQKYIRYGVLQAKLLKMDGTYRKDAVQEEISEFEKLKQELEIK